MVLSVAAEWRNHLWQSQIFTENLSNYPRTLPSGNTTQWPWIRKLKPVKLQLSEKTQRDNIIAILLIISYHNSMNSCRFQKSCCDHGVLNFYPHITSICVSGSVGHGQYDVCGRGRLTKSTVDERLCQACSVQLFLVLKHFLGVHFQPKLKTYTHKRQLLRLWCIQLLIHRPDAVSVYDTIR